MFFVETLESKKNPTSANRGQMWGTFMTGNTSGGELRARAKLQLVYPGG
jgi:hypothetical protein